MLHAGEVFGEGVTFTHDLGEDGAEGFDVFGAEVEPQQNALVLDGVVFFLFGFEREGGIAAADEEFAAQAAQAADGIEAVARVLPGVVGVTDNALEHFARDARHERQVEGISITLQGEVRIF